MGATKAEVDADACIEIGLAAKVDARIVECDL